MHLRNTFIAAFIFTSSFARAQKIDSIYVNLYTDSLKKGTYNYINVDGRLSNGRFMPLDSTDVSFWASDGKFFGNTLWIDKNFDKDRVFIKVKSKHNPGVSKEFTMYIKKKPDDEKLKTSEELLGEMQKKSKVKKKS